MVIRWGNLDYKFIMCRLLALRFLKYKSLLKTQKQRFMNLIRQYYTKIQYKLDVTLLEVKIEKYKR